MRMIIVSVVMTLSWTLSADVTLPKVFSDNMVLQREMPVPIWGWADKGEKVTVAFAGQEKTATAGDDGRWAVTLDALKASKESAELKAAGTNAVVIKNA